MQFLLLNVLESRGSRRNMSGQIFISYRREETPWLARSLCDRLCAHFDRNQIFMDLDTIAPGENFLKAIEKTVSECDVLIAVIGAGWLTSKDEQGGRRLDNPADFVRMEIATALRRDIRVIPVLVDGVSMPPADDLPEDLKQLVFRNALQVEATHFDADCKKLVTTIEQELEKTAAERRQRERRARVKSTNRGAPDGKEKQKGRILTPEHPRLRLLARLSLVACVLFLLSWLLPFQFFKNIDDTWNGAQILCYRVFWSNPEATLVEHLQDAIELLSALLSAVFLVSSYFLKYPRKAILEVVVAWVCFVTIVMWFLFPFDALPSERIGAYLACAFAAAGAVMETFLFRYRRKAAEI